MKDDAIAELAAKPVGTMVYGPCPPTAEDEGVGLFVREAGRAINTRNLGVRVGLVVGPGASPGVVMLSGYRHYAAWLNWHEPEERELIQSMESQEWMPVFCYDENLEPARAVRVRNQWGKRLAAMMKTWRQSSPWSAEAFQEVVDQLLVSCHACNVV